MANLFEQANERKKWDATIAQVGQMGYPQNPAQPPAFTSPQPRRPNSFGDAAAATNNPGVTQLPNSPAQGNGWRTKAVIGGAADDAQAAWNRGGTEGVAGALGAAARGVITAGTTAVGELAYNKAAPVATAAKGFWNGLTGGGGAPTPATTLASAVPGAPPQAEPAAPNPTDQRLAMGTQTAQSTAPALPTTSAPAPSAQPAGNEIAPGVYRNAPGQYSDNAQGMNMPAGFTGRPNPQNMAAAANLAASQQAPTVRSMAEAALIQPSGVQAPVVRNSTNDWAARNNLRNLEVSASSITNQPGFSRGGRGYVPPDVAAYQAALQTDAALQQAQPGMDQTAMRENAGIQREGMQQQGATTRTGMQERGSMGRTMAQAALEQQKINQAGESQGFANRAAAQSEQLRNVLLDPNATPEQRKVAQRSLSALSGKTAADRMQVVNLPDTDNGQGQVLKGGQALVRTLEDGTVEQVPIGTQRGATAPLANHVAALKANPKQAAQFDEIYGPGAAARAIGK